ncbi:MAG: hypothetical protein IPP43_15900 [Chitinophagaceae bacterium]|nr:hypothetical protein [Chitinophagaceae bacterium]MBL0132393.1 hypothetical protein [Chitinophagaceae bacterium]
MDTNQPTTPTPPPYTPPPTYVPAATPGMFGTKIPSSVAFVVAILLFLLPFSEIRCGGSALMNNTGIGFALGKDWKISGGYGKDMLKDMDSKTSNEKDKTVQYLIIAALGLGVLGLLFSLAGSATGARIGIVTGVLGAGTLVAFMLILKKWFNDGLAKQAAEKAKDGTDSLGLGKMGDMSFSLAFTPWFYIAVISFLAAAFFCYKRMTAAKTG